MDFERAMAAGLRRMKRVLPAVFLVVAIVPTGHADGEIASDGVLRVPVIRAEWVDRIDIRKAYTGQIEARRSSLLGFRVPGRVEAVRVVEGARVKRGEVLAELATPRFEAHVLRAEAELSRARAQLEEMKAGPREESVAASKALVAEFEAEVELARLKAERRGALLESRTISKEEHEESALSLRAVEARLSSARQQLAELEAGTRGEQIEAQAAQVAALEVGVRQARIDLDDARLLAPFDGVVTIRLVDEGTVLESGQPVLELLEVDRLEARVGVPPVTAAGLTVGETLTLRVGSREVEGVVSALLPTVTATTRTVPVILGLTAAENEPQLRTGEVVRLEVSEAAPLEGVWLPTSALVRGLRGLWACNVVAGVSSGNPEGEGSVERREVELVHTEADRALVRGPLREGEWVIESGNHRIVPGQRVRAMPTED